jgi:hypothetical protein
MGYVVSVFERKFIYYIFQRAYSITNNSQVIKYGVGMHMWDIPLTNSPIILKVSDI